MRCLAFSSVSGLENWRVHPRPGTCAWDRALLSRRRTTWDKRPPSARCGTGVESCSSGDRFDARRGSQPSPFIRRRRTGTGNAIPSDSLAERQIRFALLPRLAGARRRPVTFPHACGQKTVPACRPYHCAALQDTERSWAGLAFLSLRSVQVRHLAKGELRRASPPHRRDLYSSVMVTGMAGGSAWVTPVVRRRTPLSRHSLNPSLVAFRMTEVGPVDLHPVAARPVRHNAPRGCACAPLSGFGIFWPRRGVIEVYRNWDFQGIEVQQGFRS